MSFVYLQTCFPLQSLIQIFFSLVPRYVEMNKRNKKKANWEKRRCILPNEDFYIFHLPLFITASSLPFLINHILNSSIRVQISSQTKPVKHLSWSFLEKTLTAYSRKQFRQIIPPQTFERVLDNTDSYFDESNSLSD